MNKFALVAPNGEVRSIVHPADDNMFTEGEQVGDETAHSFAYEEGDLTVMEGWYWQDEWIKTKPERPSAYHYWNNYQWNLDTVDLMVELRAVRDLKLIRSDWTQFNDSPLSDSNKTAWATYRAALRDVPADNASISSLDDVTWPTQP